MHLINITRHLAKVEDRDDIQKAAFIHVALVFCVDDITSNLKTKAHGLELLVRDWLKVLKEKGKETQTTQNNTCI